MEREKSVFPQGNNMRSEDLEMSPTPNPPPAPPTLRRSSNQAILIALLIVVLAVDVAMLGLPLYPGAHRVEDDHDSAQVRMNFPGEQSLNVLAAKFETSDPLDKVRAFYQDQLSSQTTRFTEKNSEGSMVFEIKQGHQEKIVALKNTGSGTRISMVRILHGAEEAN